MPARFALLTRPARFALLTSPTRFAVLTRPARFAVLIKLGILDKYPVVPRPITVLVKFACVKKLMPTINCVEMIGA
jgi:hypothetical protein